MVEIFFSVCICTLTQSDKEQETWEKKNIEAYAKGVNITYAIIVLRLM